MIWQNNPVLVQLLGLSPVLAVSNSLTYGVGLGVATLLVCVFSCLTASLLKNYVGHKWRLVWYMLILASYTTLAETLCQIYYYPLSLKLGIYLPLICCNVAILIRMENVSTRSNWVTATLDATKTGLGFLLAILLVASLRELLIGGTVLANWQLLLPSSSTLAAAITPTDSKSFFQFANTQSGVLLLLGMLIAALNFLSQLWHSDAIAEEVTPAKRARVTGRLSKE